MKQKVAVLLIMSVLISTLFGCEYAAGKLGSGFSQGGVTSEDVSYDGFSEVDKRLFDITSEYYEAKSLTLGFESLPKEEMKECYNKIDESIYFVSSEKKDGLYKTRKATLDGVTLSEAELRVVIASYLADHPEVFWLDNNFEYASDESGTVLQFSSFMSADEIENEALAVIDKAKSILSGLIKGLSEYDRELYIHDALIDSCEYDDGVLTIDDNFRAFTLLGALQDESAVCEGYSRAFQYLLSICGIESYCVLGTGEDELHMWNVVSIYDNWYYVDTTWDEDEDSGICYDYFNLSEDQLSYSHSINYDFTALSDEEICGDENTPPKSFNIATFTCTDGDMTYYMNKGVSIDGIGPMNKEKLTSEIERAAESSEDDEFSIFLYIDTDYIHYDYAVNNLFYSGEYLIFQAIDEANYRMDKTVDRNSVSIKKIRELSAVNVYLTFE